MLTFPRTVCAAKGQPTKFIVNIKILKIMKLRALITGLLLLSTLIGLRAQDKCPNVIVVRKALYDSFQTANTNVQDLEQALIKARQVRDDLYRQYHECQYQSDIADMLKQKDVEVQNLEARLKPAKNAWEQIDQELRRIIHEANGVPVVYRFYDSGYGNFGRVWTMTFSPQDGKIVIIPSYYQLPDQVASAN